MPCIVLIRFKVFQLYRNSQTLKLKDFAFPRDFTSPLGKNEKLVRPVLRLATYQRATGERWSISLRAFISPVLVIIAE